MSARISNELSFTLGLAAWAWVAFASLTTLYTLHKEGPGRCAAYGERHSIDDASPIVDLVCIPFRP
jgi:hypothetical protein